MILVSTWLLLFASTASAGERGYRLATGVGVGSTLAIFPVGPVFLVSGAAVGNITRRDQNGTPMETPVSDTIGTVLAGTGTGLVAAGVPALVVPSVAGQFSLPPQHRSSLAAGVAGTVGLGVAGLGLVWGEAGDDSLSTAFARLTMVLLGGGLAVVGGFFQMTANIKAYKSKPAGKKRSSGQRMVAIAPTPTGAMLVGTF